MAKTLLDKYQNLEGYLRALRDEFYRGKVKAEAYSKCSTDNSDLAVMFSTMYEDCRGLLDDNRIAAEDTASVNYDNPSHEMFLAYEKEYEKQGSFHAAWNAAMAVARKERG